MRARIHVHVSTCQHQRLFALLPLGPINRRQRTASMWSQLADAGNDESGPKVRGKSSSAISQELIFEVVRLAVLFGTLAGWPCVLHRLGRPSRRDERADLDDLDDKSGDCPRTSMIKKD